MTFKKFINNFLFFTVVMTTSVFPGSAEDVKLSAEYLSSHELASDLNTTSDAHKAIGSLPEHIFLKFKADGAYEADVYFGQWGFPVEGQYVIKNGQVTLTINDKSKEVLNQWLKDDKPDRYNKFFLRNGVLVDDDESVKYRRYIRFDDGTKLLDKSTLIKEADLPKKIGSVKVITMGMRKGVAKQNVKLREKADAGSKDLRYCRNSEDGPCTNYIPKGDEVIIIARTRNKFKVQKWEGYWYYVEFPENIDAGWVFSEFIDLK